MICVSGAKVKVRLEQLWRCKPKIQLSSAFSSSQFLMHKEDYTMQSKPRVVLPQENPSKNQ